MNHQPHLTSGSLPQTTTGPGAFDLLETLAWYPRHGFVLIDEHLARLGRSALALGFSVDIEHTLHTLQATVVSAATPQRVRLTVDCAGRARATTSDMMRMRRPLRVTLSSTPVSSGDAFLYHKTTNRALYERALILGFDEVLLWNERGEVTEATTGNVVAVVHGRRMTPPVTYGLLPGTYRHALLAKRVIHEGILRKEELGAVEALWIINSVQGWRAALLEGAPG